MPLKWKDDGTVERIKAEAAEGDDPNDLLQYDFGVRNLMNKAGLNAWERVVVLKRKLRNGTSEGEKDKYRTELLELSEKYHFSL